MSINPISPIPTAEPRDALMRALAVAETVVAGLPVRPTEVTIQEAPGSAYRVVLYFHHEPSAVRRFGAHFDTVVSTEAQRTDVSARYTSAECTVDGVRVRAWALVRGTAAGAEAVAA